MTRDWQRAIVATFVALAAVVAASAQSAPGAVAGVVRDSSGGVLPGVSVTVSSQNIRQAAATDSAGRFRIAPLVPGSYRIEATLAGFRRTVVESVSVVEGRDTPVELALRIGILSIVDCVEPAGGLAGALRRADAAVRVRIAVPLRSGLLGDAGVIIGTEHRADVMDVVKGSDRGVKIGDTVLFRQFNAGEWVEDNKRHVGERRPYRSGDEIVELLSWDARDGWTEAHCGHLAFPVIGGFVQLPQFLQSPPAIRSGMPVDEFMAMLGKLLVS